MERSPIWLATIIILTLASSLIIYRNQEGHADLLARVSVLTI